MQHQFQRTRSSSTTYCRRVKLSGGNSSISAKDAYQSTIIENCGLSCNLFDDKLLVKELPKMARKNPTRPRGKDMPPSQQQNQYPSLDDLDMYVTLCKLVEAGDTIEAAAG